jgi:hypothetical protein
MFEEPRKWGRFMLVKNIIIVMGFDVINKNIAMGAYPRCHTRTDVLGQQV